MARFGAFFMRRCRSRGASGVVAGWLMNGATITSAVNIGSLPPSAWTIQSANAD
jgi:hypothetical protein